MRPPVRAESRRAMRRRSRLLRVAKWGGVAVFAVLAAALCFSLSWEIGLGFDRGYSACRLNAGCLYYDEPLQFGEPRWWPSGFFCTSRSGPRRWIVPYLDFRDDWSTHHAIPLWPGLGLIGLTIQGYWGGEMVYRYGAGVRAVQVLSEAAATQARQSGPSTQAMQTESRPNTPQEKAPGESIP